MQKIYEVTMGANNPYSIFRLFFDNLKDAEKCLREFDKNSTATSVPSVIKELTLYSSSDKLVFGEGK